jgi:hypothetical protein
MLLSSLKDESLKFLKKNVKAIDNHANSALIRFVFGFRTILVLLFNFFHGCCLSCKLMIQLSNTNIKGKNLIVKRKSM